MDPLERKDQPDQLALTELTGMMELQDQPDPLELTERKDQLELTELTELMVRPEPTGLLVRPEPTGLLVRPEPWERPGQLALMESPMISHAPMVRYRSSTITTGHVEHSPNHEEQPSTTPESLLIVAMGMSSFLELQH